MTVAVARRRRVTASFLGRAGGWFELDGFLYQLIHVPDDVNARCVTVENAEAPPGWTEERARELILKRGRVVEWPPGLE